MDVLYVNMSRGHSTFFFFFFFFFVDVCDTGFQKKGLKSGFSCKNEGLGDKNLETFESRELKF